MSEKILVVFEISLSCFKCSNVLCITIGRSLNFCWKPGYRRILTDFWGWLRMSLSFLRWSVWTWRVCRDIKVRRVLWVLWVLMFIFVEFDQTVRIKVYPHEFSDWGDIINHHWNQRLARCRWGVYLQFENVPIIQENVGLDVSWFYTVRDLS